VYPRVVRQPLLARTALLSSLPHYQQQLRSRRFRFVRICRIDRWRRAATRSIGAIGRELRRVRRMPLAFCSQQIATWGEIYTAAMAAVLSSSFTTVRCSATAAPRASRSGVAVGAPVQFAAAKGLRASSSVALAGKRVESPLTVTRAAPSPSTVSPVARQGGGRRGGRDEPDDGFEERLVQVRPSPQSPIQLPRFRKAAFLANVPASSRTCLSREPQSNPHGTSADSRQLAGLESDAILQR
jgi:hypothetical protein